ncbi:MAG: hypothetical protein F6K54_22245 [Okeania sp. SIO3B5]|uniref:hypothetical protein n=1 Tax=Okeania sp. SIO3B5 TaxID=2607811 RepID=UPI001400CC23|nr:hypothetical protein [Okeania sp. SIO3B5]NEO55550.1 hypothetical protein [Okeania sp. SIO3B5]
MFKDYLVVDTEGNPLLKEIAVINSLGNLIFEAIVTNNDRPLNPSTRGQSLVEVLNKFLEVISEQSEALVKDEVVLDEPILISPRDIIQQYFDRQKVKLKSKFMEHQILTDLDDVGKLETIIRFFKDSWDKLEIEVLNLGKRVTPEHLVIKIEQHQCVIAFLHEGGSKFFARMRNYNELMSYHPLLQFKLCRDETDYPITGRKSRQQLDNFKSSPRGDLIILNSEQRILFESIYQTIVDMQNLDLEVSVDEFIKFISSEYGNFWLWKILPI